MSYSFSVPAAPRSELLDRRAINAAFEDYASTPQGDGSRLEDQESWPLAEVRDHVALAAAAVADLVSIGLPDGSDLYEVTVSGHANVAHGHMPGADEFVTVTVRAVTPPA